MGIILNKIIVLGDDFWNTLGVIRSFGEAGYKPYFINIHRGRSFVRHSRYIKQSWQVDTIERGFDILYSFFGTEKIKPVVICTSDKSISFLDKHYNEFCDKFILPNAARKQGEINRLMDKDIMLEIADKVNMLHPKCLSVDIDALTLNALAELSVNYPCLTKPLMSIEGTKADIVVCENKEKLWTTLQKIKSEGCYKVQIQDYIRKECEMLIFGCSLSSGEIIIPGIIKKIREFPFNMGTAAYAEISSDVEKYIDTHLIAGYLKEIKYSGLFSMEFLLDRGQMYFLEINLRNDGHGYAPTYGGVNIPVQWTLGEVGKDISNYPKRIGHSYHYQIDMVDLAYMLASGKSVWAWLKAFIVADFHLIFSKKDPLPFMFVIINGLLNRIQKNRNKAMTDEKV